MLRVQRRRPLRRDRQLQEVGLLGTRTRYVARRLALAVPTAFAVLALSFTLIHLAPGDPVTVIAGDGGDEAYYAEIRERYGLDRPVPVQFASWLGRIAKGDLGRSYIQQRPVRELITERVPATLLLTGSALVLSTIVGILLGMLAASRPGRLRDVTVSGASVLLFALPAFWIGQLAILWLALETGWFPVQGMTDARADHHGWREIVDVAHHLALPALVLSGQEVAAVARITRSGVIAELDSAHIVAARAKGLPERRVYFRHALRRPLLPVATIIGSRLGQLIAGATVVEIVFSWPGMGRLLLSAMQNRDAPVVLGVFLVIALTVIVANLLVDVVTAWLDPRITLMARTHDR